MKYLFYFLGGCLLDLCAHTLFGSWGFWSLACLYAFALFLCFFRSLQPAARLLIGVTVTEELLGTAHLGLASLLCLIFFFLQELFGQQLRFTSLYTRYIVSLGIGLLAYTGLLYESSGFWTRLISLIPLFLILSLTAYFFSAWQQEKPYEII